MDCNDYLRAAIGILLLLVICRLMQEPSTFNQRTEFMQMVYTADRAQQKYMLAQLSGTSNHVYYKQCADVVVPVCKEIIGSKPIMVSVGMFCEELLDYCARYEVNSLPPY